VNDEQFSHVSAKVTDTETGEETSVIIDTDGNQVHLGDQVDDDTQTLLDSIGEILSMGEEDRGEDDLDRGH
jgi:hypothetical protein